MTTNKDLGTLSTNKINNNISDAAIHAAWDGLVVPCGVGVGMDSAIDPSNTTTPIQDAIDTIGATESGTILIPPTSNDDDIQENGPTTGGKYKRIIGMGGQGRGSTIQATNDGHLFEQDTNISNDWQSSYIDGLRIIGNGVSGGRTSGAAFSFRDSELRGFNIGKLRLGSWFGTHPIFDLRKAVFDSTWDWIYMQGECDPSHPDTTSPSGLIYDDFDQSVTHRRVNHLTLVGRLGSSKNIRGWSINADAQISVGGIQAEDKIDQLMRIAMQESGSFVADYINHESTGDATPMEQGYVIGKKLNGDVRIGLLQFADGTADDVFYESGDGRWCVGNITVKGGNTTLNGNKVRVNSDNNHPSTYGGVDSEVNNDSGAALSNPVLCLGSGTWKTSTGTGYTADVDRKIPGIDVPLVFESNPASQGQIRLANNDTVYFRNNADDGDVRALLVDASDRLRMGNGASSVRMDAPMTLDGNDLNGIAQYSDDTNPPNDTLYYDTSDSQLEYKDTGGTIHNLG